MNTPLRIAYYGDDFTGSTDVMEALSLVGVRTVLFLSPPTPQQLAQLTGGGIEAVGVAGRSRAMTNQQMSAHLPEIFATLKALNPQIVHYKVCSTFDSSPHVGSIGLAIDLAQQVFASPWVPLVVAAPALGRYCIFGNLFARSGGDSEVHRLDRHPTMSRHPVTPMDEADLTRHLGRQTQRRIMLLDLLALARSCTEQDQRLFACIGTDHPIVLFDSLSESDLQSVGRLIWTQAQQSAPLFAAGSSGLEYALAAHWQAQGSVTAPPRPRGEPVKQLVVVSGSCSPVTARQIDRAVAAGFHEIALEPADLLPQHGVAASWRDKVDAAVSAIAAGRSVILHAAKGPDDPRVVELRRQAAALADATQTVDDLTGNGVGTRLGQMLDAILSRTDLPRAATTGGDTSGRIAEALGIESLGFVAPMAPGSPLCRVHAPGRDADGREMVFKGGQVGRDDLLLSILRGHT